MNSCYQAQLGNDCLTSCSYQEQPLIHKAKAEIPLREARVIQKTIFKRDIKQAASGDCLIDRPAFPSNKLFHKIDQLS